MKKIINNRVFRICFVILLFVVTFLSVFRVPTRLSAARFNKYTNLPVGLLEKGVDWSDSTSTNILGIVY